MSRWISADITLRESKARPMDNTKGGADISDAATRTLLSQRMHPKLLTYLIEEGYIKQGLY